VRCWEACTDSSTGPPTAVVTSEAMSYTLIDQGRGGTVESHRGENVQLVEVAVQNSRHGGRL
jgi:hypothetical protein